MAKNFASGFSWRLHKERRSPDRRLQKGRFGKRPSLIKHHGGSLPLDLFQQSNDIPVIACPIANHDNNRHAANENLRLQNLWDGIEVFAAFFSCLENTKN